MSASYDPLLPAADRDEVGHRWTAIETGFVEDPERHLSMADELLGDVIARVSGVLGSDRERLGKTWRAGDVTTEQRRELLLRYREAIQRLAGTAAPSGTAPSAPAPGGATEPVSGVDPTAAD